MENSPDPHPAPQPPNRTIINGKWFVIALVSVCLLVAIYATWRIKAELTLPTPDAIPGPNGLTKPQEAELAKIQEAFAETVRQGLAQDRVIAAAKDLIDRAPDSGDARLVLAQAYLKNNRPDLAYEQLNAALKLQPDLVEAHLLAGTLAIGMDKKDEALEHYKRALAIEPTNERARLHMAQFAISNNDFDQALSLAQAAADRNSLSHTAQAILSEAYFKKGDFPNALKTISRAIELAPEKDRPQTIVYIRKQAAILRAMKRPQEALACLRKLTPEERSEIGPLEDTAITFDLMGQANVAALLCDEMARKTPLDWKYAALSARWWIKAGDLDEARKQLKVVESLQPGSTLAKDLAAQIAKAQPPAKDK